MECSRATKTITDGGSTAMHSKAMRTGWTDGLDPAQKAPGAFCDENDTNETGVKLALVGVCHLP